MTKKQSLQPFNEKNIRTVWDDEREKWYFSVVDVIEVLTNSIDPAKYWRVLKTRLKKEGNETATNCSTFKLLAADGKMRLTDVADMEQMFRIIQSVPSPNAEPFKLWMAQVAATRIDQLQDPELSIQQAVADYRRLGYSEQWINERVKSIDARKALTDEWQRAGITDGRDYATLTDIVLHQWSGLTTKEYKHKKSLHKENLRDNMTRMELALNTLAEVATTEISQERNAMGMRESMAAAKDGGSVAMDARKSIEAKIGRSVITDTNAKDYLPEPPKVLKK